MSITITNNLKCGIKVWNDPNEKIPVPPGADKQPVSVAFPFEVQLDSTTVPMGLHYKIGKITVPESSDIFPVNSPANLGETPHNVTIGDGVGDPD